MSFLAPLARSAASYIGRKWIKRKLKYQRKFRARRNYRYAPIGRYKTSKPIYVKKTILLDKIDVSCNTTHNDVYTFQANDLGQIASYNELYDQYRIDKVVCTFQVMNGSIPRDAAGFYTTLGRIHSIIDYTDNNSSYGLTDLINDSTYKCTKTNRDHKRVVYPKYLNDIGGNAASQPTNKGWISTSDGAVSHYGIKLLFEGGSGPNSGYISFTVQPKFTYYLKFKDPK